MLVIQNSHRAQHRPWKQPPPEETTTAPEQTTTAPVEVNEYAVVEKFIELYNASSEIPISDLAAMDIQGEDYRTEFRLNAFKNAVGQKGAFNGGSIQIVNYGVWSNDEIRIYAQADSHDTALEMVYSIIHILDNTITDDEIAENLDRSSSIVLGTGGYISGYLNESYTGIYGIMIDCSRINFLE